MGTTDCLVFCGDGVCVCVCVSLGGGALYNIVNLKVSA